jgi:hypothetical protein
LEFPRPALTRSATGRAIEKAPILFMKMEMKPVAADRIAMMPEFERRAAARMPESRSKSRVRAKTCTTSRISTTVMTTGLAAPAKTCSAG